MIVFDKLWVVMAKKEMTEYRLKEITGVDNKTIQRLHANENVETKTLNKLCVALGCKLEEITEYIPD